MSTIFTGSCVAMCTPFKDGAVDFDAMRRLIDWHITEGTDALLICGTTGESSTLDDAEHREVLAKAGEMIDGRVPFVAGTGSNDTAYSVDLTRYAKCCGADGALVINPYYNKTSQEGIYRHIATVAEANPDMPIIVYNVPGRTGSNIAPATLKRLAEIDNISAVKEASGSISQIAEIIEICPDDFTVYSGNDDQTLPIIALGGKGVISVTANILPKAVHDMAQACLNDDMDKARELFRKINPVNRAMFFESNPIPVKTAMRLMGLDSGERRLPLVEMGEGNEARMVEVLKAYGGIL